MTWILHLLALCLLLQGAVATTAQIQAYLTKVENALSEMVLFSETAHSRRCFDAANCSKVGCSTPSCGSTFTPKQGFECSSMYGLSKTLCGASCKGLRRAVNRSTVSVPPGSVTNASSSLLSFVCSTSSLDPELARIQGVYNLTGWMYMSHISGGMRVFPGAPMLRDGQCSFEPRLKNWYVSASSGPKDIVLLLDKSGSMGFAANPNNPAEGTRWSLLVPAVTALLDTLTPSDWVTIVWFSTGYTKVTNTVARATPAHIAFLKAKIAATSPGGGTGFVQGFTGAFSVLSASSTSFTSGCSKMIMFLTDGVTTDAASTVYSTIVTGQASLSKPVTIFTYSLSNDADNVQPQYIACKHGGIWQLISNGVNPLAQMSQFFKFIAAGLVSTKPRWTPRYNDTLGLGDVTTVSRPYYDRSKGFPIQVGVAAIDVPMAEIFRLSTLAVFETVRLARSDLCDSLNLTSCRMQQLREPSGYVCPTPQPALSTCNATPSTIDSCPGASVNVSLNMALCEPLLASGVSIRIVTNKEIMCCDDCLTNTLTVTPSLSLMSEFRYCKKAMAVPLNVGGFTNASCGMCVGLSARLYSQCNNNTNCCCYDGAVQTTQCPPPTTTTAAPSTTTAAPTTTRAATTTTRAPTTTTAAPTTISTATTTSGAPTTTTAAPTTTTAAPTTTTAAPTTTTVAPTTTRPPRTKTRSLSKSLMSIFRNCKKAMAVPFNFARATNASCGLCVGLSARLYSQCNGNTNCCCYDGAEQTTECLIQNQYPFANVPDIINNPFVPSNGTNCSLCLNMIPGGVYPNYCRQRSDTSPCVSASNVHTFKNCRDKIMAIPFNYYGHSNASCQLCANPGNNLLVQCNYLTYADRCYCASNAPNPNYSYPFSGCSGVFTRGNFENRDCDACVNMRPGTNYPLICRSQSVCICEAFVPSPFGGCAKPLSIPYNWFNYNDGDCRMCARGQNIQLRQCSKLEGIKYCYCTVYDPIHSYPFKSCANVWVNFTAVKQRNAQWTDFRCISCSNTTRTVQYEAYCRTVGVCFCSDNLPKSFTAEITKTVEIVPTATKTTNLLDQYNLCSSAKSFPGNTFNVPDEGCSGCLHGWSTFPCNTPGICYCADNGFPQAMVKPYTFCTSVIAVTGNTRGVTDNHCARCSYNKYAFYPCDAANVGALCQCAITAATPQSVALFAELVDLGIVGLVSNHISSAAPESGPAFPGFGGDGGGDTIRTEYTCLDTKKSLNSNPFGVTDEHCRPCASFYYMSGVPPFPCAGFNRPGAGPCQCTSRSMTTLDSSGNVLAFEPHTLVAAEYYPSRYDFQSQCVVTQECRLCMVANAPFHYPCFRAEYYSGAPVCGCLSFANRVSPSSQGSAPMATAAPFVHSPDASSGISSSLRTGLIVGGVLLVLAPLVALIIYRARRSLQAEEMLRRRSSRNLRRASKGSIAMTKRGSQSSLSASQRSRENENSDTVPLSLDVSQRHQRRESSFAVIGE